jgi:hypothetical protein
LAGKIIGVNLRSQNTSAASWAEFARVVLRAVPDAKDDDVPADGAEKDFIGEAVGEARRKPR